MKMLTRALLGASALSLFVSGVSAETLTIATVNNGDMIRMQGLTDDFTEKTGHTVEWVTLEENVLRQRVTTDIATTEALIPLAPEGAFLISESGIGSAADCARLEAAGAHGFLVGESLMRQADVAAATRTLLHG